MKYFVRVGLVNNQCVVGKITELTYLEREKVIKEIFNEIGTIVSFNLTLEGDEVMYFNPRNITTLELVEVEDES